MSRISTIHHSLRSVNSRARNVYSVINIPNLIDWAAMNAHPQSELWMFFYLFGNVDRTINWCFRTVKENERDAIARGKANQFSCPFRGANLFGATDDLTELFLDLTLLVDEQFRIPDHVHEEDVADR